MESNFNSNSNSSVFKTSLDSFHNQFSDNLSYGEKVIEMFKKGSKIHIKKANRGKFTEYCGGKVTEECIRRGKNSTDPKIRKRATFAQNARRWSKK